MNAASTRTTVSMDTVVTFRVVGQDPSATDQAEYDAAIDRAIEWFRLIEATCNRFDAESELRRLCTRVGISTAVSPILLETLRFALALAEETDGAFDPTVGRRMEARGFDREYRSGGRIASGVALVDAVSYRDVELDAAERTVTLHRPLLLDLGAVAKGFAIDVAARELAPFENFAIDAGGDLYLAGTNERGDAWSVGIRHPRVEGTILETLFATNAAVCTSGDYERRDAAHGHHILDPRTGSAADRTASVTVVAPIAMVADGLATAAFVLGRDAGLSLLERHGARGILYTSTLERCTTRDA